MQQNCQKRMERGIFYSNLYSHDPKVLPYDYWGSENCLRQLSNIIERRLKRK